MSENHRRCLQPNSHGPVAGGRADEARKIFQETAMPRGSKQSYTDKQKRQAKHIEESYEQRGVPEQEAKRRAWATENKVTGGGMKGNKTRH